MSTAIKPPKLFPTYDEYKDSGVEWLGEIPESWELKPGLVALKENKRSNKGMVESTVLSLSYGNIVERPEEKLTGLVPESFETYQIVEKDDIIIRCTDLQNDKISLRTGLAKQRGIITSAYLNLLVNKDYDATFMHYYLHSIDTTKVVYQLGSGLRQNLSYLDFKRFPVLVLPKQQQTLIAQFLDQKTALIDQAIAIKEQQIRLLNERKQIIIQQAVTQGLNPNAPMKDSGVEWIGQIPEHWEVKRIKHCLSLNKLRVESSKTELQYFGMESIQSEQGVLSGVVSEADGLASHFQKGDILFGKLRPYLAKVWLADCEGTCSTEFLVFSPKKELESKYVALFLLSKNFINTVDSSTYGSKMPRASTEYVLNLFHTMPPKDEQAAIVRYIKKQADYIDRYVLKMDEQITALKEYKTTLINSAVTGKIKITEAMLTATTEVNHVE